MKATDSKRNAPTKVEDDLPLLESMVRDSASLPTLYRPGPYWQKKTNFAVREIRRFGISDFRGSSNSIGTSFTDKAHLDVRGLLNSGIAMPIAALLRSTFPFSKIFDAQVGLTRRYFQEALELRNANTRQSPRVTKLLETYRIPEETIRGGCIDYCEINGQNYSNHYLQLLDTHDRLSNTIDFGSASSFFEIGGGFGVNVHILLENYPRLRKILYLDIPPNLYIGTQYLRSFYGGCVKTYTSTRSLNRVSFSANDDIEILCIAPHQIERFVGHLDIFQNAHSFVEMPVESVRNYAAHVERLLPENSQIALVSYGDFDPGTTMDPVTLPTYFSRPFESQIIETLLGERTDHIHTSLRREVVS